MNNWVDLIPLLGIVLVFWLLIVRPARARQKQYWAVQEAVEPGRRIMLASGIFGEVLTVDDTELDLRIAPDVVVRVHRQAVGRVLDPAEYGEAPDPEETP